MRRFFTFLAVMAMVVSACGSEAQTVESATATNEVPAALPSGREAIAANQGKAHVLWFWGAH